MPTSRARAGRRRPRPSPRTAAPPRRASRSTARAGSELDRRRRIGPPATCDPAPPSRGRSRRRRPAPGRLLAARPSRAAGRSRGRRSRSATTPPPTIRGTTTGAGPGVGSSTAQQLGDVDVLRGEAAAQHVVARGHELDAEPLEVGVQNSRGHEHAFAAPQRHEVHQQRHDDAGIARVGGVQTPRRGSSSAANSSPSASRGRGDDRIDVASRPSSGQQPADVSRSAAAASASVQTRCQPVARPVPARRRAGASRRCRAGRRAP